MVSDMLDMSQLELETLPFAPKRMNPVVLINSVKDIFHPLIVEKNIKFMINVDEELAEIKADSVRLKQILFHAISNAVKFTPQHGSIEVRVFPVGEEWMRIEISDTGIGIQEQDLAKLFVPFDQLDSSSSKRYSGTGIGLPLIQRIVRALNGEVGLKSAIGKGSLFFVALPREPK